MNESFFHMRENYLFSNIEQRVREYKRKNPGNEVISLGIGDVTQPLCDAIINELHIAVDEMAQKESFKGYGPERGYRFLREAIQQMYLDRCTNIHIDEIFVSDGIKSDIGNMLDVFRGITVLIPDPVYPAYVDANLIAGNEIVYVDATAENGFLPIPDNKVDADVIYMCSPNNPTGTVYDKDKLELWVDYAIAKGAVIFFDAAYKDFITDDNLPRSIFEIDRARCCAIEFCSFSKNAGFTGMRCGYTVIPRELIVQGISINKLWVRRQSTKFNGVSYIIQKGAWAALTPNGQYQIKSKIKLYRANIKVIEKYLKDAGVCVANSDNSPYVWFRCPNGMGSWDFFDYLLDNIGIVGTPGAGFGKNGTDFFRLTAFGDSDKTLKAMELIKNLLRSKKGRKL